MFLQNKATKSETSDRSNPVETIVVVPELNVSLHLQSEDEEGDSRHQVKQIVTLGSKA